MTDLTRKQKDTLWLALKLASPVSDESVEERMAKHAGLFDSVAKRLNAIPKSQMLRSVKRELQMVTPNTPMQKLLNHAGAHTKADKDALAKELVDIVHDASKRGGDKHIERELRAYLKGNPAFAAFDPKFHKQIKDHLVDVVQGEGKEFAQRAADKRKARGDLLKDIGSAYTTARREMSAAASEARAVRREKADIAAAAEKKFQAENFTAADAKDLKMKMLTTLGIGAAGGPIVGGLVQPFAEGISDAIYGDSAEAQSRSKERGKMQALQIQKVDMVANLAPIHNRVINDVKKRDFYSSADKGLIDSTYETMKKFAPILAADENMADSFIKQHVVHGETPSFAAIKSLADAERSVSDAGGIVPITMSKKAAEVAMELFPDVVKNASQATIGDERYTLDNVGTTMCKKLANSVARRTSFNEALEAIKRNGY